MNIPSDVRKLLKEKKGEVLKLEIGCGNNKDSGKGWIGMDIRDLPAVDVLHDMQTFPWPFPDETFTLLSACQVIEHLSPANFGFFTFMDECWRVLKPDGQFRIATPYGGNSMWLRDPTHQMCIIPQTFHYLDPMQQTNLYKEYMPKPWKIEQIFWNAEGNIEALLSKRREDPSYKK